MTTLTALAMMEHLEKIPYLLSLFLPIVVFFFFGLWIAYRKWSPDAGRLKRALSEHETLSQQLATASSDEKDLGKTFQKTYHDHWKRSQAEHNQELATIKANAAKPSPELLEKRKEIKEMQFRINDLLADLMTAEKKLKKKK